MTQITWSIPGAPPIPDEDVRRAVEGALARGGRPGLELAVVFVGDDALARMHAEHLGDPSPTDVLAFDLGEEGAGPAGELYVSVERAHRVALQRGVDLRRELSLYVVHGVLHLCGHDDREPDARARMRAAERAVRDELGCPADDAPHDHGVE